MIKVPQILSQSRSIHSSSQKNKQKNQQTKNKQTKILLTILFSVLFCFSPPILPLHSIFSYPSRQKQSLPNCFTRFIYILHSFNIFIFEAKFFLKLFPVAAWMVGKIILSCQKLFFAFPLILPFLFKMYITCFKNCNLLQILHWI